MWREWTPRPWTPPDSSSASSSPTSGPCSSTSPLKIAQLANELIPSQANARRLILIGDVHGLWSLVTSLLTTCAFDPSSDHIIFVGDLITKGPTYHSSLDVLHGFINLQSQGLASAVRGNHEERVIRAATDASYSPDKEEAWIAENLEMPDHLEVLTSLPHILTLGNLPGSLGNTTILHAGLDPALPFEEQEPECVMNVKSFNVHGKGGWSKDPIKVPGMYNPDWTPEDGKRRVYNEFGLRWAEHYLDTPLPHQTIVHGHDALHITNSGRPRIDTAFAFKSMRRSSSVTDLFRSNTGILGAGGRKRDGGALNRVFNIDTGARHVSDEGRLTAMVLSWGEDKRGEGVVWRFESVEGRRPEEQ